MEPFKDLYYAAGFPEEGLLCNPFRTPSFPNPKPQAGNAKLLRLCLEVTLTYQNLLFCRVPINSILGFIIRTYKKVGFGRLK